MRLGDKLKKNFAKNLQNLRTQQDLTQAKLADTLNEKYRDVNIDLQRTSIVNYETGSTMPKIDALYCIADYFGKSIDQMISPTMEKPLLSHYWIGQELRQGPVTTPEMERRNALADKNEREDESHFLTQDANVNKILATCVNGILNRQFYVEFLRTLYQKLLENAATREDKDKFEQTFLKTFLSCQLNKSKYLQDLTDNFLDEQEYEIFMAFQDTSVHIDMVAKAHGLTENEVIVIFNTAQNKISSLLEGHSKPDVV